MRLTTVQRLAATPPMSTKFKYTAHKEFTTELGAQNLDKKQLKKLKKETKKASKFLRQGSDSAGNEPKQSSHTGL